MSLNHQTFMLSPLKYKKQTIKERNIMHPPTDQEKIESQAFIESHLRKLLDEYEGSSLHISALINDLLVASVRISSSTLILKGLPPQKALEYLHKTIEEQFTTLVEELANEGYSKKIKDLEAAQ